MRLIFDTSGQDLVEYALLSAIIATAGAALLPAIAAAMKTAYATWQTSANAVWEPCPPAPAACP